jgi:hypothetical protein
MPEPMMKDLRMRGVKASSDTSKPPHVRRMRSPSVPTRPWPASTSAKPRLLAERPRPDNTRATCPSAVSINSAAKWACRSCSES